LMLLSALFGPETAHAMGTTGAQGEAGAGGTSMLIMLVAIFAIFYFLIRPESKRRKERQAMIDSLSRGDKIVTIGGLYGEVQDVHEDRVVVRIAEGIKVEVAKSAVSGKRE
jgi:preprotein translocase subunit YajC